MASAIDATKPTAGSATTQSVRDNFAAAKAEIEALQNGSSLAAGSVSDNAIGNRTPDQSVAAVTGPGTPTQIFNWFANRLKAISGETNWYDAVGTSLKSLVASTPIYISPTAFTPTLVSAGGGAPVYSTQAGSITKIGARRHFTVTIILSSLGTLGAGNLSITGLPEASAAIYYTPCTCYNNAMTASVTSGINALISPGTSSIALSYPVAGGNNPLTMSLLTATSQIMISGSYFV